MNTKFLAKIGVLCIVLILSLPPLGGAAHNNFQIKEDPSSSAYHPGPGSDVVNLSIKRSTAVDEIADILLIQTNDPWEREDHYVGDNWYDGITSDTEVLDSLGYTYNIADWNDISSGLVDIYQYPVILIVNDQIQEFYDSYATHVTEFEEWVASGHTLVFFAAGFGWAGGALNAPLPGGVIAMNASDYASYNVITDLNHPIVTNELSQMIPLVNEDLYSNYCSHGYFTNLVSGTNVVFRESVLEGNFPTMIDYSYGSGRVIASTLTWEHNWSYYTTEDAIYGIFARKSLDDVFLYAFSYGVAPVAGPSISLAIEDAPPGVIVNVVPGDTDGAASSSTVEIVSNITLGKYSPPNLNFTVTLNVPGDVLGNPVQITARDTADGVGSQSVAYTENSPGQYTIANQLSWTEYGYLRQVVWRFNIPGVAQSLNLSVHLEVDYMSLLEPDAYASLQIVNNASAIILVNRTRLFDLYEYHAVNALLNQVYTIAQGAPRNSNPLSVIYYVDRYSHAAATWNNFNVDYENGEVGANIAALSIDALVDDWYEDIGDPTYLLILGDDNAIPFYRYNDPTNGEQTWDINNANNPAIHATDEDYILSDNIYADIGTGTSWQTGDLELAAGRVLGATIYEIQEFLLNGTNPLNPNRGAVVMAAVDGWELGLEPHTGPGQDDLLNVPQAFINRGFSVRNDDDPTTEVRTIDMLTPEGGINDWIDNFKAASNLETGMDLFFIGGHDSYNTAYLFADLSGDDFTPDDTPGDYTRFEDDHPVVLIPGCHGGLPVPEAGNIGGHEDSLVFDLVHEGSSAYIGATGFSYGSPGNLNSATFAENLIQRFFSELLEPDGNLSQSMAESLRIAKGNYAGLGPTDLKTLTEFNLYGVPWQRLAYPETAISNALQQVSSPGAYVIQKGIIEQVDEETFTQDFSVDFTGYTVSQSDGFDFISLDGGAQRLIQGMPVLPYIDGPSMELGDLGEIMNIEILGTTSSPIGPYNIGAVNITSFTEGGITYFDATDMNYLFPENLVASNINNTGVNFEISPIQHNPATNETLYHEHIEFRVTYSTSSRVNVFEYKLDNQIYNPGETITSTAQIANLSNTDLVLAPVVDIINNYGAVIFSQPQSPINLPAGQVSSQVFTLAADFPGGEYKIRLTLTDSELSSLSVERSFAVMPAQIKGFYAEDPVFNLARFDLVFTNNTALSSNATVEIDVYDWSGKLVNSLPQQAFIAEAGMDTTINSYLNAADLPTGQYSAVATVEMDGITYGPGYVTFNVVRYYTHLPMITVSSSTSTDYNWIDAVSGGTIVAQGDDVYQYVDLPFSFQFYGNDYNGVYISSNGFASFGTGYSSYSNGCIPSTGTPNNAIYAYWDDLIPSGGTNGNVYVKTIDSSTFVIEWHAVKTYDSSDYLTFEIILRDDNTVTLQYHTVGSSTSVTVGVEDLSGTLAQQYICNGIGDPLLNELAILYSTP